MTLNDDENVDVINALERIERFFDGDQAGDIPPEIYRARRMDISQAAPEDAENREPSAVGSADIAGSVRS